MTIGRKLTAGCAAMLLLAVGAGLSSSIAVNQLESDLNYFVHKTARREAMAGEVRAYAAEMASIERAILIRGMLMNAELVARHKSEFHTTVTKMEERLGSIRALAESNAAGDAIQRIWADVANAKKAHFELTGALEAQQADRAIKLYDEKIVPLAGQVADGAVQFIKDNERAAEQSRRAAETRSAALKWLQVVLAVICAATGGVVVYIVLNSSRELQVITSEMNARADQVAEAAAQVSNASRSLAEGSSRQACSLETTSASSEEMASMTSRNRDNAVSAARLAGKADVEIATANLTLDEMINSMSEISSASDQISRIIKVIDEIAFQTNILALNAAVEAARAGEAGMGFAVVADEVRNLAQRCAQAAHDTTGLIENSISKTSEGRAKLDRVAGAIRGITATSKAITTLVEEVKLGSEEQTRGFDQVSRAIAQIQQVTNEAAASAEETASSGQEMAAQADALRAIMRRLQALVGETVTCR
jgi:methyl-accepting chemotaxis protein/methyl-accepting chemotaxis protein-1 (serine sensor receptor)